MSCHDQGTNAAGGEIGVGIDFGYLRVLEPVVFTREELQAIRDRMRDLLARTVISEVKREFMECLVDDLDMLDALEAREEEKADLAALEEKITEHMGSEGVHVTHQWPPCCEECPNHRILINLVGLETASKWPT